MPLLSGLTGRILFALAMAGAAGGSVFVESDGGNSATIIQGGPFGDATVELKRGDGYVVVQRHDAEGNSATIIQSTGEARD
jgi:hypothetical protein